MQEKNKKSRWLRGLFFSAADAADAWIWLCSVTRGDANLGVDYERLVLSMIDGGKRGGDFYDLCLHRKIQIARAFESTRRSIFELTIWRDYRIKKRKIEHLADQLRIGEDRALRIVASVDVEIEEGLADQGIL